LLCHEKFIEASTARSSGSATTVTAISAVPAHPKKSECRPSAETTHYRKARNDHHHGRHDRNGDNAIGHGASNQHLDGIDWRISERESHDRGGRNES